MVSHINSLSFFLSAVIVVLRIVDHLIQLRVVEVRQEKALQSAIVGLLDGLSLSGWRGGIGYDDVLHF